MATTTPESALNAKTVSTSLTVNDVQASIRFFEGLGFAIEEKWEKEGTLLGVMMQAGEAHIGLSQDDWKKGRDRQKGIGVRIYISITQDVDQVAAKAKAAGITLDSEPKDMEWGSRAFEVTEPSGFKITIAKDK